MRKCIKCGRELSLGMFDDNWRHKVNICKDCKREQNRKYYQSSEKRKKKNRLYKMENRIEELRKELFGAKESRN